MTQKVYIIAEVGVNHNGDVELAKKMIEVAAQAGVDAVKFQSFKSENLVTQTAVKAEYQKKSTSSGETQYQMLKKLELNIDAHHTLIEQCKKCNV